MEISSSMAFPLGHKLIAEIIHENRQPKLRRIACHCELSACHSEFFCLSLRALCLSLRTPLPVILSLTPCHSERSEKSLPLPSDCHSRTERSLAMTIPVIASREAAWHSRPQPVIPSLSACHSEPYPCHSERSEKSLPLPSDCHSRKERSFAMTFPVIPSREAARQSQPQPVIPSPSACHSEPYPLSF